MEAHIQGNHRNIQAHFGKTESIIVPIGLAKRLEEAVEESDLVDQHWVLKTFKITKKTLSNYISSCRIPKRDYTVAFNNTKWFFKSRLFGLRNLLSRKKAA